MTIRSAYISQDAIVELFQETATTSISNEEVTASQINRLCKAVENSPEKFTHKNYETISASCESLLGTLLIQEINCSIPGMLLANELSEALTKVANNLVATNKK